MSRFRITNTFIYEIESDLNEEEINKNIQDDFSKRFQDLEHLETRRQIKVDRLRERRSNIKLGVFSPEDVLPYICMEDIKRDYIIGDKIYTVRMNSQRYQVFRNSIKCIACGLIGCKMILEQNPMDKSPHFNLYGEENGKLILMTKDHFVAKSKGGSNLSDNMRTCCQICNNLKGNYNLTYEQVDELRKLYNQNNKLSRKKLADLIKKERNNIINYINTKSVEPFLENYVKIN